MQLSPGCAAIHGFPEGTSEIRRDELHADVHPDDLARLDGLLSQAFAERRDEYHTDYRILRSGDEVRWIEARALIMYDGDGRADRVVGINIDVTERKRAEAALEESDARYRALYHDNPSMYFTLDAAGMVLSVNEFGASQLGYTPAELVGRSVLQVIHEEEQQVALLRLASCAENPDTIAKMELRKVRRDGSIFWASEVARAVREPGGRTVLLVVCKDITDLKRAEDHQSRLMAELDHRVKNVLARLSAVAMFTREGNSTIDEYLQSLDGRIQCLADAHVLLSNSRWKGVGLADLVRHQLAPYMGTSNTTIGGPDVTLSSSATEALAMVLFELVTNAAKYGAFSTPHGQVCVTWHGIAGGRSLESVLIEWRESGGPPVAAPTRSGYGISLIRELIPHELGGTVDLAFPPEGVSCRIVLPLEPL